MQRDTHATPSPSPTTTPSPHATSYEGKVPLAVVGLLSLSVILLSLYVVTLQWETGRHQVIPAPKASASRVSESPLRVARVIQGDTLELGDATRVRLIGVDTPGLHNQVPELDLLGQQSLAFARLLVEGRTVRLEYEGDRRDASGRVRAYAFLEDGTSVNAEIIRQGYGWTLAEPPFASLSRFRQYETEAQRRRVGFWADRETGVHASPEGSATTSYDDTAKETQAAPAWDAHGGTDSESLNERADDALAVAERSQPTLDDRPETTTAVVPVVPSRPRRVQPIPLSPVPAVVVPAPSSSQASNPSVAENGSYYGEPSERTGRPKTVFVEGYTRRDGTYVRGHYRSRPRF